MIFIWLPDKIVTCKGEEVDEEKKELVVPSVGVIEIFKFSTPLDTALICIGILLGKNIKLSYNPK